MSGCQEIDVERYLVKRVRAMGGQCFQWVSPRHAVVPDRIGVLPQGQVFFVEVKRPGDKPTKLEIQTLEVLTGLGCRAVWLDSKEAVDEFLT